MVPTRGEEIIFSRTYEKYNFRTWVVVNITLIIIVKLRMKLKSNQFQEAEPFLKT